MLCCAVGPVPYVKTSIGFLVMVYTFSSSRPTHVVATSNVRTGQNAHDAISDVVNEKGGFVPRGEKSFVRSALHAAGV